MEMVKDIWAGQGVTLQQEEDPAAFRGSPGSFPLCLQISSRILSPELRAGTASWALLPGVVPGQTKPLSTSHKSGDGKSPLGFSCSCQDIFHGFFPPTWNESSTGAPPLQGSSLAAQLQGRAFSSLSH